MDPIRDRDDEPEARPIAPTAAEVTLRLAVSDKLAPITPPRVLIVDDDADILAVLELLFTDDGFKPICCGTNEAALAALAADAFQLIITDLRLVGGTGLDLIRHVRAMYSTLPGLIVLTAMRPSHAAAELDQIVQLGGRVIAKPFDIDDLLGAARTLTGWPGRAMA